VPRPPKYRVLTPSELVTQGSGVRCDYRNNILLAKTTFCNGLFLRCIPLTVTKYTLHCQLYSAHAVWRGLV
jgi:hypothetical protein